MIGNISMKFSGASKNLPNMVVQKMVDNLLRQKNPCNDRLTKKK